MKLLIDECAPRALKQFLVTCGHDCQTVQEAGWAGKQNGELLKVAENVFDAFITLDTNLQFQQSLRGRRLAILLIRARSNRLLDLQPHFLACADALNSIQNRLVEIGSF